MAYVYSVQTSKGTYDVTVQKHHEHMSKADFERALLSALLTLGANVALHHYTFKRVA
ncbi:MAG: hypothetical protein AABZ73_02965 [Pseudomonadota bacterium]|uniref:hypothetical protein n=1 Tax=Sphingobium sp. TaxID=1912891 RepID=UPI002E1E5CFE